jgi:hypothetical protein
VKRCLGLLAGFVMVVALASCNTVANPARGQQEGPSGHAAETPVPEPAGSPIDWGSPLNGGITLSSTSQAAQYLQFSPATPDSLGAPSRVEVSDPKQWALEDRAVAWVYESSPYGTFAVVEAIPTLTQAELESMAGCPPDSTSCVRGATSLVKVNGVAALLITGPGSTEVRWLEGGHMFVVMGPSSTFTPSSATSVANKI